MKRPLQIIFCFVFFVQMPLLYAANCISNGGGEWTNPATWLRDGVAGVPQPGDQITIIGPDIITITSTVDLSTTNDNNPILDDYYGYTKVLAATRM